LSFDGEVIGDAPLRFVGGVLGRPLTVVGELGDAGRRKGDERGELKEEDLYEAYTTEQSSLMSTATTSQGTHRPRVSMWAELTILTG